MCKCANAVREPESIGDGDLAILSRRAALGGYLTFLTSGFICLCASLAYLTMATGHGYIIRCCDGRSFYYARYIDWTVTTPIMLFELSTMAISFQKKDTKRVSSSFYDLVWLLFIDVLMIIAGLIGALLCDNAKWAFWGFSMLCFLPILWQLCAWDNKDHARDEPNLGANPSPVQKKKFIEDYFLFHMWSGFKNPMYLTVILWSFYPIVWIFAEGTDQLSANGEAVAYTVLDILAKSLFGFMIVSHTDKGFQVLRSLK